MLKSSLKLASIEQGGMDARLDDAAALAIVRKELKKRQDSIEQFTKGGRPDLAEKEKLEAAFLQEYLPQALTPEELEALNQWIRSRSLATLDAARAPTIAPGDARGFENQQISNMDRSTITSRLVGTFTGWDGETVFKLENGMIWAQADKDKFYIRPVENPAVKIEPGAFKTWRLSVEGYSSECRVERIQ